MIRKHHDRKAVRFAVCGAVAMALAGCAGTSHFAKVSERAQHRSGTSALDRDVERAEAAVRVSPRDAAARLALGNAYLRAGRFDSAATTFQDAAVLGDDSGGTALRLALARIGGGRGGEAAMILDQHRDTIPASDLGLALALAGETRHGVNVLLDALRAGENSAKLRQNLAYAYALDGRWAEARVIVGQDLPADQIGDRISKWAMMSRPEDFAKRVATLLHTPLRADAGQPVELALAGRPNAPAQPLLASVPAPDVSRELPPIVPAPELASAETAAPAAPVPPVVAEAKDFATAFNAVSRPVVQPIPARASASKPAPKPRIAAARPTLRGDSHFVQLGSFSSPEAARRATKLLQARNPELRDHEFSITPAIVGGRHFWRVAAADFSRAGASVMCSKVKARGGGCIAYSLGRPLPGAIPGHGHTGPLMARR
jgi:Flp pilus assembly protein TadD